MPAESAASAAWRTRDSNVLRWRIVLGVVLVGALAALAVWEYQQRSTGVVMWLVALGVGLLATQESLTLVSARPPRPNGPAVYAGALLTVGLAGLPLFWTPAQADCPIGPLGWPLLGLAAALLIVVVGAMREFSRPGTAIETMSKGMFAIVYPSLLLAILVALRGFGSPREGLLAVLATLAVVKASDTGQYLVGRLIGRHKMAPTLSPGKTWEGAAGGLITACLTSYGLLQILYPSLSAAGGVGFGWGWLLFGGLLTIAGLVGDLAASLLKRDAGRKDSSTWMPGFGGVLDLLDSLLAAAPVGYACWAAGVVGL